MDAKPTHADAKSAPANATAYRGFARLYDALQTGVDYDRWAAQLECLLHEYGSMPSASAHLRILDLACGTGAVTIPLAQRGHRVDGIDLSEEMLSVAQSKALALPPAIRPGFYAMDMRDFRLRNTYDAAVCVCDGANYLLEEGEMRSMLERTALHLTDRGLFLLDMSSRHKLERVIGDRTIAETFEDGAFVWENEFDGETGILDFKLTLFHRADASATGAAASRPSSLPADSGVGFIRIEEYHSQRAYEPEELISLAAPWFDCRAVLDGERFAPLPHAADSPAERLLWIFRKK